MIGDIKPKASVVTLIRDLITIEFAREIDADVLADLDRLKSHAAIQTSTGQYPSLFWVKESYDPRVIAEAISKSLEQNHSLEVRRVFIDSTHYKDIRCFTEGKQ